MEKQLQALRSALAECVAQNEAAPELERVCCVLQVTFTVEL
jgi:hypothetical protein